MITRALRDYLESWDAGAWGEAVKQGGVYVLRSTNLAYGGEISYVGMAQHDIPECVLSEKKLVQGDILLERSGGGPNQPVGRVALFSGRNADENIICGNFISRLVPKREMIDSRLLLYQLLFWHLSGETEKLQNATTGIRNLQMENYLDRQITIPTNLAEQRNIAFKLKSQLEVVAKAKRLCAAQLTDTTHLADSIIRYSIKLSCSEVKALNDTIVEVNNGIGNLWKDYHVLGATRKGLAPAREPPGKNPQRYKPVTHSTVFYNPMRIMIGSIAFVDEDDEPGITSPDYVVLKGKKGVVDSRWFYYWLRSPFGEACILSLARGAVRERMLFNRLAEGEIELPDFETQLKASKALAQIKPMQTAIGTQLKELDLIPQKLLAQTFES